MLMNFDLLTLIILTAGSLPYFLLALVSLRRRGLGGRLTDPFALYAAVSCLWGFVPVAARLGWLSARQAEVLEHLPLYGLLLLALLFLHLTRSFLRLEGVDWRWWALGGVWIAVLVILDSNAWHLPEIWRTGTGWMISRQGFISAALIFGWGTFTSGATLLTARAYRRTQQPLHKNRIKYWVPALGFTILGDALFFAGQVALGSGLHLFGILIAAYVVLTHHLPDVRQVARRVLSYLFITVLFLLLYTAGFVGLQLGLQAVPGYSPLWVGAGLALILALLFNPLLGLVQKRVNRLISGTDYDPSRTAHEYGLSISNILDLERLAAVALGLIHRAIGIRRGVLFLVDQKPGEAAGDYFHLRGVRGLGIEALSSGVLSAHSPLVVYLQQECFPLTQYDLDLLPRFQGMSVEERAWLSGLGMDVYVPIFSKGQWIGLLGLGPKVSGDRYFGDDLTLLSTLADQTAMALENARLVGNLRRNYQQMAEMKNLLDDIFASIPSGVITTDIQDKVINFNVAAQRILGLPADSVLGQPYRMALHEIGPHLEPLVQQVKIEDHPAISHELSLEISARGRLNLRASLSPLKDARQETIGVTIVLEDLTEQRRLEADRERIRQTFGHVVAPRVRDKLLSESASLNLAGTRQEITTLFADVRGFTTLSEKISSQVLFTILNEYLKLATEAVLVHEGTIDKFLGDAVMAFFNAPDPQPDHTLRAVKAALDIQAALMAHRHLLDATYPLYFGVGITVGEAVVGNVGTAELFNYTAIGDSVNLAKRLQENAAPGQILLSQMAYLRVQDQVEGQPLAPVQVKGREAVEQIYAVIKLKDLGGRG